MTTPSRPHIPSSDSYPYLHKFFDHFRQSDYTFEQLQKLFPDTTLTGRDAGRAQAYRMTIEESGHPALKLAQLWLLRDPLTRHTWQDLMGDELVVEGLKHGLINGSVLTHLEASFDVQPALDSLVFTDPKFRHQWESDNKGVYYLGSDSYALVNCVPRAKVEAALDIFTGSGVHAVLAAKHADRVTGVDINPRAVALATTNAALNRQSHNCEFLQGNLLEPVQGRRFDLITANPPFVPTPDKDLALYRSGGPGGEFLTSQVLSQLHDFLNPGGIMAMVTNYPVFDGIDIVDHHRSMLSDPDQFGIALLHSYTFPRETYIQMHLAPTGDPQKYLEDQARWLESYGENGIKGVGFGVLFFCRLEQRNPWSARKDGMDLVHHPMGDDVARWLSGLTKFGGRLAREERLTIHPDARIFREKRTGEGMLAWATDWPGTKLSVEETNLAWRLAELDSFLLEAEFEPVFRKLGREGALIKKEGQI